jgi:hypothetical protein
MKAIMFYQEKDGNIGQNPPIQFLSKKQRLAVYNENQSLRTSLYKMFLFESLLEYVKGGRLSLKYSYEYRALQKYLIDVEEWQKDKADIMKSVGLTKYADVGSYLEKLKSKLEATYESVNKRFSAGHNGYLKMRPNGRFHVTTPAIDYEKSKYISSLLSGEGKVPVLQVLKEVDRITDFTKSLTHHSVKNTPKQVGEQVAIAAIMALGCNIGPRRMARKSVGKSVGVTEASNATRLRQLAF